MPLSLCGACGKKLSADRDERWEMGGKRKCRIPFAALAMKNVLLIGKRSRALGILCCGGI